MAIAGGVVLTLSEVLAGNAPIPVIPAFVASDREQPFTIVLLRSRSALKHIRSSQPPPRDIHHRAGTPLQADHSRFAQPPTPDHGLIVVIFTATQSAVFAVNVTPDPFG
jgi:hypothetical protein